MCGTELEYASVSFFGLVDGGVLEPLPVDGGGPVGVGYLRVRGAGA